jgi:methyl-accepting chemotaxis protein
MTNEETTAQSPLSKLMPRTLRGKAIVLLLGAVVGVALVAQAVFAPLFADTIRDELNKRGNAISKILEQHQGLRLALSLKDGKEAGNVAKEILDGDKDVRYVVLLDDAGAPLGYASTLRNATVEQLLAEHEKNTDDDVQRFSREVVRTAQAANPDEALLTGDAGGKKTLGKILLGLSGSEARARLTYQAFGTIALSGLVLTVLFMIFFSRIASRLNRMAQFAARVAAGDLGAEIRDETPDEVGRLAQSLTEMTDTTGAMVKRLQDAASALARASSEILSSSTQQGEAATKQATSVSETGATVAELRETFNQAAERAQAVIDFAKRSEESTSTGRAAVQESILAMEQIRDQVLATSKTIVSLVDRTNQISTIIDTVNDLAEQSNVLALNAAIEAAKAGEHGRGFAVVAREVRNLAERSMDSTAQIRAILKDVEKATRDTLGVIEEGTRKTQSGMELANRAGESILLLDRAINDSSTAAKQIAASTRQQAVGVDQIWQAMRDIDRAVNESATGIRQLEAASKNMKTLSDEMARLVAQYSVNRVKAA